MSAHDTDILWLEHAHQRLGLLPALGGSAAAWQAERPQGRVDLWRRWDGARADPYTFASFPLVPWSNRISGGGFDHAGRFHAVAPNRAGEPYPIHGDGWLQRWQARREGADTVVMTLESDRFGGNPYRYRALQRLRLLDGGLDQDLEVTHLGDAPLPYGLGQHPYFPRRPGTRLRAPVSGVWLSGPDALPTGHAETLPPGWDLCDTEATGSFVDNAFTGWSGAAHVDWPGEKMRLTLRVPGWATGWGARGGCCLLYRPPHGDAIAFEPITHPIDAFHLPGRPGLVVLERGQRLALRVEWRFGSME
ncbi:MAG TPA: aldose 1-epimerase [Gemmatimonadales bacterium]|nr:aldose 1-epimerase [Gemmatimonadales bacterium]